jgi:hypothetical protein
MIQDQINIGLHSYHLAVEACVPFVTEETVSTHTTPEDEGEDSDSRMQHLRAILTAAWVRYIDRSVTKRCNKPFVE